MTEWMSLHDAAARLGVAVSTVSRLAVSGRITTDSAGRVPKQAVEFIAQSRARGDKAWRELETA